MATVYRFRNAAAVALSGKGETRYLSAPAARGMARALLKIARSIESESFTDSACGTWQVPDHCAHADIPAPARFAVTVDAYSLAPGRVGDYERTIYESSHKSPRAAARRLAELINGRTARAKALKPALAGRGGRYTVDGLSLVTFRKRHGLKA